MDDDGLFYKDAIKIVRDAGYATVSLLQRKLKIGYARGARMLDLLEERGIVGELEEGSHIKRKILPYE